MRDFTESTATFSPCREFRKARKTIPRCPRGCISAVYETEPGRYCCRGCSAVFEQLESGALDDRPDVNAEKRERASEKLWKGGRR